MAAKHDIAVHSRFSVLANEDSDSSEEEAAKGKDVVSLDAKKKAKNAKKRARKKKKTAEAGAASAELRQMAFGGSKPGKQSSAPMKAATNTVPYPHPVTVPLLEEKPSVESANEHEWIERDEQFVINQFQKDVKDKSGVVMIDDKIQDNTAMNDEALRQSMEDAESCKMLGKNDDHQSSKKKKKDSVKISLEEFQGRSSEGTKLEDTHEKNHNSINGFEDHLVRPAEDASTKKHKKKKEKHHEKSETKTEEILEGKIGENHTENETVHPETLDLASIQQWMNEVEKRDKENEQLRKTIEELKTELTQVKKRNKQLCFILGQGEMRDKSEILIQVDELTNVKDELSTELTDMHSLLEQERSKVSALKQELTKSQTGRSKKHSYSESEHR